MLALEHEGVLDVPSSGSDLSLVSHARAYYWLVSQFVEAQGVRVAGETREGMLVELREPLEVQVAGGDDLSGQIVIAAAALLGAILTVLTANRRHRQQLAHDRELRSRDLAHDREMREQEEMRNVLVSVTESVVQTMQTLIEMDAIATALEDLKKEIEDREQREGDEKSFLAEAGKTAEESKAKLNDLRPRAHKSILGMVGFLTLLRLRLKNDDPIAQSYTALQDAYRDWFDSVKVVLQGPRSDAQRAEAEAKVKTASERYRDYIYACRGRFMDANSWP